MTFLVAALTCAYVHTHEGRTREVSNHIYNTAGEISCFDRLYMIAYIFLHVFIELTSGAAIWFVLKNPAGCMDNLIASHQNYNDTARICRFTQLLH